MPANYYTLKSFSAPPSIRAAPIFIYESLKHFHAREYFNNCTRLLILLYTYNIYAHKTQFSFTTRNVKGF